jgi:hypothetical protein
LKYPDLEDSEKNRPVIKHQARFRASSVPCRRLVRGNTLAKLSPPLFRRVFVPPNAGETQMHIRRGGGKAQGGIHFSIPVPPLFSLALGDLFTGECLGVNQPSGESRRICVKKNI